MPPKKNAYLMPDPLPKGLILTDLLKQKWVVGTSIGKGGFGEIYSAAAGEKAPSKEADYTHAVKIEPMQNGPLFVERMFYLRVAKAEMVSSWIKDHKLKSLGMPIMYGHGSYEGSKSKSRFLVMDRFSRDLHSHLKLCNGILPTSTVLQISSQIVDVLEFIHSNGYVHADVKAQNLMLGFKKGTENQVYVIDFGLADKYSEKKEPKKKHNGTIEYTSRDMHEGGVTRRGDMEILAYNMVHWLTSKLPWDGLIKNCVAVQEAKIAAMQDVPKFLKSCFGKKQVPDAVANFVKYVTEISYADAPDYAKIKYIFVDGLKSEGIKLGSPLNFTKPLEQQNGKPEKVRTSPRKANKRGSIPEEKAEMENADSSCESGTDEHEDKRKKRKVGTHSKSKSKPPPKEKVSWKDCPTVKASGVVRAGEYVSRAKKT